MSGPIPKRDNMRRRANAPALGFADKAPGAATVDQPVAEEDWHPMARDWYESLAQSGQAAFYEPSDWQQARVLAVILTGLLKSARPSAPLFAAWVHASGELLTTEGQRRRLRLELQRAPVDEDESRAVSALDAYRARLGS